MSIGRTLTLATLVFAAQTVAAQAIPAGALRLRASVFAGATAMETGLNSGRNLGVTGGLDVEFPRGWLLVPALEYRGTLAIDQGAVDGQKRQMGGVKLTARLPLLQPYATVLYGREEIHYVIPLEVPGTPVFYRDSSSNVIGVGGGVEYDLRHHLGLKLDIQADRYATPVKPASHLFATSAMVGVVYRLHFGLLR